MLIKLGRGFGCGKQLVSEIGGGGPATYSSFEINMGASTGNWQALSEMLLYDAEGNEFGATLTAIGETVLTMEGLSAGEYTSNSTYGAGTTDAALNDGVPNSANAGAGSGTAQWSDSATTPLVIFIKPYAPISLSKIELCASVAYSWEPAHASFLADGVELFPVTAPEDVMDYLQTTANVNIHWYRWTF